MEPVSLGFVISAFIAGLLTFLAPCTLPLVPGYLGFISGVSAQDLKDPLKAHRARKKIFLNGLFFVIGFSVVFIFFGTLAGFVGQNFAPYRLWLGRIGGFFVVLFGLLMIGALKIPFLQIDKRMNIPSFLTIGRPASSLIIGGTFAFGWTPCVGPILGSILLLASIQTSAFTGALLLGVFSFGLAIPFLLIAFVFSKAMAYINAINRYLTWASIIGGMFLIVLGLLLMTDNFGLLIQYGFRLLEPFEYKGLLKYL